MEEVVSSDSLEEAIKLCHASRTSADALRRLAAAQAATDEVYPRKRTAAVLVLVFIERGELCVLLTTRALTLRTSPGETALPGGRIEVGDQTIDDTALREAYEEVHLPRDTPLLYLTTLPAFLSYTLLYVIPVVYLLATPAEATLAALKPNPAEVSAIFTARLSRFVSRDVYTHSHSDVAWIQDALFRLHAFKDASFASDITGLTADILISVALLAEGADARTIYDRTAPGQLSWKELVQHVLDGKAAMPRTKG